VLSQAVPGLPDPLGVPKAVQAQQLDGIGLQTAIDVIAVDDFMAALAASTPDGLYRAGVGSSVADPDAFLGPAAGRRRHQLAREARLPERPGSPRRGRRRAGPAVRFRTGHPHR